MGRHPNNGPTFSKPTTKKDRPVPQSPLRRIEEEAQAVRDAEKSRDMHKLINEIGFAEYRARQTRKKRET
jgi:hypothetical protein